MIIGKVEDMNKEEVLIATVVVDPHNGKTNFELTNNEELDVGQIEDFSDEQISELGLVIRKQPIFLYWLNLEPKVSESRLGKFDSVDDIKKIASERKIYVRWIKRHRENSNCVMSFHEMPEDFDEKMDNLMTSLYSSIFNLMKELKSEKHKIGDAKKLAVDVYNMIKNYPYELYTVDKNK